MPRHLPLIAALCAAALSLPARAADTITAAGAWAAAPVYRVWAAEYARGHATAVNYEAVGADAGMERIDRREVDFGAVDSMQSPAWLAQHDLVMFPTLVTGIVPVVNLHGVGPDELRLTGELVARIFLGQVARWDAPEIAALNPGVKLPAHAIRLVVRSDGSGATRQFADYLSRVSPAWRQQRGVASRFDWPAGVTAVQGSTAVAQALRATPDAIAYVDFNRFVDDGLTGVALKNADGQFVGASVESLREAVTHSGWFAQGDFLAELIDLHGAKSWPVTMGIFVAVPRVPAQPERAERALRFLTWAYLHGDALARQARFVPLPDKVQASAYREIAKVRNARGESLGAAMLSGAD